jgi:hypothetical protein
MATDHFAGTPVGPADPGTRSTPVTPHDSTELDPTPRALWVGTGGDVVGRLAGDSADRTFSNVPDGTLLPFRFKLIKTASTADDMVGVS